LGAIHLAGPTNTAFVLLLAPSLEPGWGRAFGPDVNGDSYWSRVSLGPSGAVGLAGWTVSSTIGGQDFGTGVVLAELDASGELAWATGFQESDSGTTIAFDAAARAVTLTA